MATLFQIRGRIFHRDNLGGRKKEGRKKGTRGSQLFREKTFPQRGEDTTRPLTLLPERVCSRIKDDQDNMQISRARAR